MAFNKTCGIFCTLNRSGGARSPFPKGATTALPYIIPNAFDLGPFGAGSPTDKTDVHWFGLSKFGIKTEDGPSTDGLVDDGNGLKEPLTLISITAKYRRGECLASKAETLCRGFSTTREGLPST